MVRFLLLVAGILAFGYFMPAPAIHHEASVEIDASRNQVWATLSNLDQLPRWNAFTHGIEFKDNQRKGQGTTFSVPTSPISHQYRITEWQPYNGITYRVRTEPSISMDHRIKVTMHPRGNRTLVRFIEDYRMKGGYLGYLFDRGLYSALGRHQRSPALANLKRLVETGHGLIVP